MSPLAYLKIGGAVVIALVIAGAVALYEHTVAQRDQARAEVATLAATNHELEAVHANDVRALAELEAAKAKAEAAVVDEQARQAAVRSTVTQWKERIVHVALPPDACVGVNARDLATLDGVRNIVGAAADPDANRQGDAAGAVAGGHSAARDPGDGDDARRAQRRDPLARGMGEGASGAPGGAPSLVR